MESVTRIAGIIIRDGKLLMLLGKDHKELWTPGGKIELGESDESCLKRELKEEMGVELLSCKFFKEYSNPSFYHPERTTIERVYIAEIDGEIKPDEEIESFVWFSKEDFENKKYPMITNTEEVLIPDLIKSKIW
jgi:8-oxo-dGTP pyrophosphatase MutT (NUDIX family)